MKEALENLKCIVSYKIEGNEVEVNIEDKDYYYKYQIERMLYLLDKNYNYKINLI